MSRDWRFFLEDMAEACFNIRQFIAGFERSDFHRPTSVYFSVERNIEILGEAAKHIPAEVRARMPEIDWRKLCGLRDILAHSYYRLNESILWTFAHDIVPIIQEAILRESQSDTLFKPDDR